MIIWAGRVLAAAVGTVLTVGLPLTAWAADDVPPTLAEDGSYPGADRIYDETGVRLIRGDGHVLMTDCTADGEGLIIVQRRGASDVCFRASAPSGYLTLEIPRVYLLRSDESHDITVTVTVDGVEREVPGEPAEWIGVGEGGQEDDGPATLLAVHVTA